MPILTNITKFALISNNLEYDIANVKQVEYESTNPWFHIAIPYGNFISQNIKPKSSTIKATCLNIQSLYSAIVSSNTYNLVTGAVNSFSYLLVTGEQSDGTVISIQFGVNGTTEIEGLNLSKFSEKVGEAEWVLQIHADGLPLPTELTAVNGIPVAAIPLLSISHNQISDWETATSSFITDSEEFINAVVSPFVVIGQVLSINESLLSIAHTQISDWASATSGFLTTATEFITSVNSPLSVTDQALSIDLSAYLLIASQYITSVDTNYFGVSGQELSQKFFNVGTSNPVSPITGELFVNSSNNLVKVYNGSAWQMVETSYLDFKPTGMPCNTSGIPNPSNQSTIAFTNATRTFTITPTGASFSIYEDGIEHTFTTAQTVVITNTEGLWYIYFNAGVLTATQTPFNYEYQVLIAVLYWDATNSVANFFADERHMFAMDWRTHYYLHNSIGTRYVNGLLISGYTLSTSGDTDVEIGISNGTIFDEDIEIDIANGTSGTPASTSNFYNQPLSKPATIPVYYQVGATGTWRKTTTANFYMYPHTANSTLYYNLNSSGTWSLADAGAGAPHGSYMSMWLFATNDIDSPIIAVMGQYNDTTLATFQANDIYANLSIASGLPFPEMKLIYQVQLNVKSSYGGTTFSQVIAVNDFRSSNIGSTANASIGFISSVGTGLKVTAGNLALDSGLWSIDGSGDLTLIGTLTTTELIIGSYYLNSSGLVANNEVLNSSELNGQAASYYLNAGNLNAGVLGAAYGGTGIDNAYTLTITTGNVALNQNLRTTDSPTFAKVTGSGWVNSSPTVTNIGANVNIIYQNTTGYDMFATISVNMGGSATPNANTFVPYIGSSSPPLIGLGGFTNSSIAQTVTQTIIIPNGWYFEATITGAVTMNYIQWQQV